MGDLILKNIHKEYNKTCIAIDDFSLEVRNGEFLVLVGPSGCGKSTILRIIAGLENADRGEIIMDGMSLVNIPPQKREVSMVFQNYALYPTKTVFDNIAFPLQIRKQNKAEINKKVEFIAQLLELEHLLKRKPNQLSGGEKQRVAMGRAMAKDTKVFLMDEPLSNLDAKLRISLRAKIAELHKQENATIIYVTHDQTEAMTLADRIVVMHNGRIEQIGTPTEIYNRPQNIFVASFFGSTPMNIFRRYGYAYGIRPEYVTISLEKKNEDNQFVDWHIAEVIRTELLGADRIYYLSVEDYAVTAVVSASFEINDNKVWVGFDRRKVHVFDITENTEV